MTQEEKARAYDEALEKAREIKKKIMFSHLSTESCKAVSEYIDTIIPQLAESEDERIRKWLIELVESQMPKTFIEVKKSDVFAWLEKQKEQKWSEEDEKRIIFLERLIEYNVPNGQYGWADGKKGGFVTKSEAISMLKSLRPQPKQKWSEEDEEMLEYIIGDVNDAQQLYTSKDAKDMADEEIIWLKSLRPSWKPTEDQMWALRAIINEPNNAGAESCQLIIRDLYEQLKKLKED